MFFFLTLRESASRPGTIEPDILPTPSSAASTHSRTGLIPSKATASAWSASYSEWLLRWDTSDAPAVFRKMLCILAVVLHVPMNVLSILAYGLSLWVIFGVLMSVLNLVCVAIALWKLEEMRGARLFWDRIWTRKTFDYIILALFLIYAFAFCMFVFAKMRLNTWVLFLRIMWPCLICTDIMCFITGWIATWRDVSLG